MRARRPTRTHSRSSLYHLPLSQSLSLNLCHIRAWVHGCNGPAGALTRKDKKRSKSPRGCSSQSVPRSSYLFARLFALPQPSFQGPIGFKVLLGNTQLPMVSILHEPQDQKEKHTYLCMLLSLSSQCPLCFF